MTKKERNKQIKEEYVQMRTLGRMKPKDALKKLEGRYNLSRETLKRIIYIKVPEEFVEPSQERKRVIWW